LSSAKQPKQPAQPNMRLKQALSMYRRLEVDSRMLAEDAIVTGCDILLYGNPSGPKPDILAADIL